MWGILVLEPKVGQLWLAISININTSSPAASWTYMLGVELHQAVVLTRDPSFSFGDAVTWSAGVFGSVGKSKVSSLRDDIKDMVDTFVNAYLAANPKK